MPHSLHLALVIALEVCLFWATWRLIRMLLNDAQVEREADMKRQAIKGLRSIMTAPGLDSAVKQIREMHPQAIEEAMIKCYSISGVPVRKNHSHNRYNGHDVIIVSQSHVHGLKVHKSGLGFHQDAVKSFSDICKRRGHRGILLTVGYGSFDAHLTHVSVISDRKFVSTIRSHPMIRARFEG